MLRHIHHNYFDTSILKLRTLCVNKILNVRYNTVYDELKGGQSIYVSIYLYIYLNYLYKCKEKVFYTIKS